MISTSRKPRRLSAIILAGLGVAVLVPAAIASGRATVVSWANPTPSEGAVVGVTAQSRLTVRIAASAPGAKPQIRMDETAPRGASLAHADGNPARATFAWKPTAAQVGEHHVTFTASTGLAGDVALTRTIVVKVGPAGRPAPGPGFPKRFLLSDRAQETYRWAYVRHATIARSKPSRSSRAVTKISTRTPEYYRNVMLMLQGIQLKNGQTWIQVRLSMLPNGRTGWVTRGSLGSFHRIHTRLVVHRRSMRATLYARGRPVFRTMVGVGQSHWPTPRGEFYVREKLSGYYAPTYGPRAFGLNARSAVLTDWPGGGFIGIHGTNEPGILPGQVSHGCIRMKNPAIMRLFRMMPLGTPVKVI